MSAPSQDDVLKALAAVPYPGFSRDIVSFGVVRAVEVTGTDVTVRLALSTTDPQVIAEIEQRVAAAVRALPGAGAVHVRPEKAGPVRLPTAGAPPQQAGPPPGPDAGRIIGVASGKGGVGKSTVAVNLAVALARRGRRVGFLDADVHGPSAPLMFGLSGHRPEEVDAQGHPLPIAAHGVRVMSMGFFVERDNAVIWRGPIVGNFIRQLLTDVAWGPLDELIIDFPPGTGDAQLTISQTVRMSGSLVVTTPNELALIDAVKAIAMFRKVEVPVLGLVENMSLFVCPHCSTPTEIFGSGRVEREAALLDVPLLGRVPIDPTVVEESDRGVPVVLERPECAAARAYEQIADAVLQLAAPAEPPPPGLGSFFDRFGRK